MVSAIFRPNQMFFKWYGKRMQRILRLYTCICVQDENSKGLLNGIGVDNVKVCGDTRFDRVMEIKRQAKHLPIVEAFANKAKEDGEKVLIVGSSWPKDEDIYMPYFNMTADLKMIIAPHETDEAHLKYIEQNLARPHIRYSQAIPENVGDYDCLIVDTIGLLSSIYNYGQISYVGGGFGVGIHNVLEAAVYGIPVIFGPNFKKSLEASQLLEVGGGYSVSNIQNFRSIMDEFMQYDDTLEAAEKHAGEYVRNNTGAVAKVMSLLDL